MSAMNFWVASARRRERERGVAVGSEGLGGGRPARVRAWAVTASGIWGAGGLVEGRKGRRRVGEGERWGDGRLERTRPSFLGIPAD